MTTSHIIMTKAGGVCEEAAGVSRAVFRCIYYIRYVGKVEGARFETVSPRSRSGRFMASRRHRLRPLKTSD